MNEKRFNVLYQGRKIYQNLTLEECSDILHEFSLQYYEEENIDPNELEIEEI